MTQGLCSIYFYSVYPGLFRPACRGQINRMERGRLKPIGLYLLVGRLEKLEVNDGRSMELLLTYAVGRKDVKPFALELFREHMGSNTRLVRELVEEVLEGGKDAFEMRWLKYGF